jgi:hypothetical protein
MNYNMKGDALIIGMCLEGYMPRRREGPPNSVSMYGEDPERADGVIIGLELRTVKFFYVFAERCEM